MEESTLKLSENAIKVLKRRYLAKDETGKPVEAPEEMFRRVAKNIARADLLYDKNNDTTKAEEKFFATMTNLEFLPNSPTLMNAGRELQQLSACFVLDINDSMESIFETIKQTSLIHKSGGGTGFSFSKLRSKNSQVKSTGGVASGPVSFLKVFNSATQAVKQGGCVDYNTIISTERGLRPIKDLGRSTENSYQDIHLKIPTDNGMKIAEQWYNNGNKLVKTLTTRHGFKFAGTLNHKIRVIDRGGNYVWKELINMREGDWVALQKNTFIGKKFVFPQFDRKFHFNTKLCNLPKKMNEGLAELIGYFVGDGCYHKGKLMLSISHDSIDLKKYFDEIMRINFGISSRYEQKKDDRSISHIYHSQMLVEWLKFVGIQKNGSYSVTIPKPILEGDRICAEAFLRGLFEADGTMHEEGYPTVSSISRDLIDQVQILFLSLGIPSRIASNTKRETSFGKNTLYQLRISTPDGLRLFKEKIGFISKRKHVKLDLIKEKLFTQNDIIPNQSMKFRKFYESLILKPRNKFYRKVYHYLDDIGGTRNLTKQRLETLVEEYPFLQESFLNEFLLNNQYYDEVQTVSYGKTLTLDLVVADSHTYIANGFISHNTRRGANMGILCIDHPDILEFITCKENDKEITNFNISVTVTEDFIEKVKKNEDYDLIDPHSKKPIKKLNARDVFNLIVKMAWKNGEPGIIFIDKMNEFNPTPKIGLYESTNPCGEQILLPYESCNLGSVNLSRMVAGGEIDWGKLAGTVETAVHFLDNVIDMNRFPLARIEEMTKANRKIGLGVMGFADMLIALGIPYNSDEGTALANKVMSFISTEAEKASCKLAEERGAFPNIKDSIYDKPDSPKLRNATLTTIAPTGTLSIIADCSSGIEPIFAIAYYKEVMDKDRLPEVNRAFRKIAKDRGFWSEEFMKEVTEKGSIQEFPEIPPDIKKIFVTSHDISPEWHIKMQAAFQRHTHNAVSKTVNFPHDATEEDIEKVYMLAHKTGCKGVTVYRDRSRMEQVLNIEKKDKIEKAVISEIVPRPRPNVTHGTTTKIATGCGNLYITINEDEEGLPFEVFMQMGKAGGCAMSQLEAIGRLLSLALRSGISLTAIIEQLRGIRCPSPSWEKGGRIFSCSDAIARVIERHLTKTEKPRAEKEPPKTGTGLSVKSETFLRDEKTGDVALKTKKRAGNIVGVCPDCGGALWHAEGCMVCKACGYSKCG
ncbi:MAG: adenosylcobalamin-dependent ribonucleoside-diphosphate reductase [Omnitrophica bacterium]|nr:adenosylcobalamin-dependent ribonucleoside-diphosphate reductase [Candidatus Omnitrophota bacterium]